MDSFPSQVLRRHCIYAIENSVGIVTVSTPASEQDESLSFRIQTQLWFVHSAENIDQANIIRTSRSRVSTGCTRNASALEDRNICYMYFEPPLGTLTRTDISVSLQKERSLFRLLRSQLGPELLARKQVNRLSVSHPRR